MTAADGMTPGLALRVPANRVSGRAVLYWTLRGLAQALGLAVIEFVVLFFGGDPLPEGRWVVVLVSAIVVVGYLAIMPRWRYAVHRWETTDTAVYTRSGWFSQEHRVAPISRVQTVDSHRGPIEQVLKLANVTITTASAAGPLKIHGLDVSTADRLVQELTSRAELSSGDAT